MVGSPLFLDTFTALGANPTQMSWADAQPAMASGAVDGQENPISVYRAAKLYTVAQKHITMWGYINDPLIFVVNKDIWNSWTPADREAVRRRHRGRQGRDRHRAQGHGRGGQAPAQADRGPGRDGDAAHPAEREAFVKATRPVFDKWKGQIGADRERGREGDCRAQEVIL